MTEWFAVQGHEVRMVTAPPYYPQFTRRYAVHMLVYYELLDTMDAAISREKQIKAGSRTKKIQLIETMNSEWLDLYDSIVCDRPLSLRA